MYSCVNKEKKPFNWVAYIFRGLVHHHQGAIPSCEGRHGAGELLESPTS